MTPSELSEAAAHLYLFPLRTVLFPHTILPLHVFEPRYRDLVRDCLQGHRCMAIPLLAEGWEHAYEGRPALCPVAGMGRIVQHEELEDGRYIIVLQGLARVRIVEEPPPEQLYRVARCEVLPPLQVGNVRMVNQGLDRLRLLFGQFLMLNPELVGSHDDEGRFVLGRTPEIHRLLEGDTEPHVYVNLVGHLVLRAVEDRQRFLECDTFEERVEQLVAALALEVAAPGDLEA